MAGRGRGGKRTIKFEKENSVIYIVGLISYFEECGKKRAVLVRG